MIGQRSNLAGGAINTSFSNTQTNIGWTIGSGLEAKIAGTNLTAKDLTDSLWVYNILEPIGIPVAAD